MKIVVLHSHYGCQTGCCGHVIEVDGEEKRSTFKFRHADDNDSLEFAKNFVREQMGEEHVADLDWENCVISDGMNC